MLILGHEVTLERRRYGNRTYTWAHLTALGREHGTLGDPWPCITPKRSELEAAVRYQLGKELDR